MVYINNIKYVKQERLSGGTSDDNGQGMGRFAGCTILECQTFIDGVQYVAELRVNAKGFNCCTRCGSSYGASSPAASDDRALDGYPPVLPTEPAAESKESSE